MFLDLDPGVKRKHATIRELPPVPRTGWKAPTEFPDLRNAVLMSLDTETKDLELLESGPGWARQKGHIVGISIAARASNNERWCGYFPIRHEANAWENCNPTNVLAWAKDQLETPHIPKTGANLIYDVGWLGEENITVQGKLYDVQNAEGLLDEQGKTALDILGYKYLGQRKSTAGLYEWLARAYGGEAGPSQRQNIWRAPPSLVGFYGEGDAALPLDILPLQWEKLQAEGLIDLYEMECKLTNLLIRMRRKGVAIDLNYAEQLSSELGRDIAAAQAAFDWKYGACNVQSGAQLGAVLERNGIKVPRTEKGAYSVTKTWLESLKDVSEIGAAVIELRELQKMKSTFVEGYLLRKNVKGRVHCSFNQLKISNDSGGSKGAKTGRLSSSDPNLQNIPIRTETGKKIRRAFIAQHDHWRKYDYSQIEYRMLAHFACDNGDGSADKLRDSYINNPDVDYHDYVYDAACPVMGWDINDKALRKLKRRPIKNVNFGLLYGQGIKKLARAMGMDLAEAKLFLTAYHEAAPYAKSTMGACGDEVHQYGYVRTILGRRTRFDTWTPFNWERFDDNGAELDPPMPLPYEAALQRYGSNIERAYAYRAVNYKLQGSAADMMKKAMVLCDESGVFDVTGVPLLTVHDELDFDVLDQSPRTLEAFRYMQHVMETAIPLRIPVRADPDKGPNWGDCG